MKKLLKAYAQRSVNFEPFNGLAHDFTTVWLRFARVGPNDTHTCPRGWHRGWCAIAGLLGLLACGAVTAKRVDS